MNGANISRFSSQIRRTVKSDAVIYEKQYVVNEWDDELDVVQRRAEQEIQLLAQLSQSNLFGRRLGVVQVADFNSEKAYIATNEVPGLPLERFICNGNANLVMPWFLAGRWLKQLQELPVTLDEPRSNSRRDPADIVDYCELRLDSLLDLGFRWPDQATKSNLFQTIGKLRDRVADQQMRQVLVHADYAPGNLMWDGHCLTPIDFAMVGVGNPLADATYLIHRVEMHQIYRPWLRLPLRKIRASILRGLGKPDCESSASYRLMMIKHNLCRLHTYVRRPANSMLQAIHDRWVRTVVRRRLLQACHHACHGVEA